VGLLALARLRAAALARGIEEIAMSSVRPGGTRLPVVRVSPLTLPASAQVRLRRVAPDATYREDMAQLLLPISSEEPVPDAVRRVMEELIPADSSAGGDTL
jgi:hypothetical protein